MKVLMINGSPHEHGSTYTALSEIAGVLEKEGISSEICWIGVGAIPGCSACGACGDQNRCIHDDIVNACLDKFALSDGLVIGAPVHYSGIAGSMKCFLDRFFYAGKRSMFHLKPATAVASLRRSGGVATFDSLNHYLTISGMVVVSSSYWNVIHGNNPKETVRDLEGMQIMRNAGRNMAYVLKKMHGVDASPKLPAEERVGTNFIRPCGEQ